MARNKELYPKKHYAGLILFTILFIVSVAAVLFINIQAMKKINDLRKLSDTTSSIIIQTDSSYRDLYLLLTMSSTDSKNSSQYISMANKFKTYREYIEKSFDAIEKGGTFPAWYDEMVDVPVPVVSVRGKMLLNKARDNWAPISEALKSFTEAYEAKNLTTADFYKTLEVYKDNVSSLDNTLKQLFVEIRSVESQQRDFSDLAQMVGMAFTLLYFLLFSFIFIRRLIRADKEAEESRRETTEIMSNISEGIFLLNPDHSISLRYSSELESILGKRNIGGRYFTDVFRSMIPKDDINDVKDFLNELFNPKIKIDLIKDLNPLENVQVFVDDFSGGRIPKYLKFKFIRVYKGKHIYRILVSVADCTREFEIQKQIQEEQRQNERQTQMMVTILNNDMALVKSYIESTDEALNKINNLLKATGTQSENFQDTIDAVYRTMHGVKGESSALKFYEIMDLASDFEDKAKELKKNPKITGNDFLPLTMTLSEIMNNFDLLKDLLEKISKLGASGQDGKAFTTYFTNFANDIAERNNKLIKFNAQGLDDPNISKKVMLGIKEIAIQLIRNSIVHGVEDADARQHAGKDRYGNVTVSLNYDNSIYRLTVEDDGHGLDFDALKKKALETGAFTKEQLDAMTPQMHMGHLLFAPGVSTASGTSQDAGRGVGMDLIKEKVTEMHGKLRFTSQPGLYTKFIIDFPRQQLNQQTAMSDGKA